ncbi:MAG: BMC domain-containing protein [Bacillota bacterium]|jgi:microcompartment protein CcmL/EutN|uniref:BMC domain-containing protein n=1 Tax=Thermanaerosceptrum fracticalcis TaxID=1712410 RepID=A0A7G6E7G0_THEFR|nr:BMC domain-containing protein [Thermanaerosceptrum fracticalcis]QNB48014.1 BMC domain-containing protein [Thermanaerosceptrum fracticalcis]
MKKAIGILEIKNITQGILAADTMLKASHVELLQATPVCPGKFMIIVAGDVGAVKNAVESGSQISPGAVIDKYVIPNVNENVFPALCATSQVKELGALGIVETYSVAAAIMAADAAVKSAYVQLIEVRLARGMGGKALVSLTGDVGAVKTAVAAASQIAQDAGMLVDQLVIPAPHRDLQSSIL